VPRRVLPNTCLWSNCSVDLPSWANSCEMILLGEDSLVAPAPAEVEL